MKKQALGYIILALGITFMTVTSCKKKDSTAQTGTFYFHLHSNIDTNEVDDPEELYADANGRHFSLSTAQFYISNVVLKNVTGTSYTVTDAHILKDIDSEEYLIGTAPIGTYNSVTFDVGLDDATNALQPTAFTTTGYLANSTMWYGNTTQGYMFMKLQGMADTSAAQDGSHAVPFSYEIGASANRKTVTMPVRGTGSYSDYPPYILTANGINYIHIVCDYGKLLSVINFKTQDSTDTYSLNPSTATTIAGNIPNMFDYEE